MGVIIMKNSNDYFIERVEKMNQRSKEERREKRYDIIFMVGGLTLIGSAITTDMGIFSDTAIPYIMAASGVGMFGTSVKKLMESSKKKSTSLNQNILKQPVEVENPKQYRR